MRPLDNLDPYSLPCGFLQFERNGTFMNAERRIQRIRKAIEPVINQGLTGKSFVRLLRRWAKVSFYISTRRKRLERRFVPFGLPGVASPMNDWIAVVCSGPVRTIIIPALK